ncbi:MAG: hypothetical protein AB4426_11970 [Xenococcaceae cyanobacterium]
MEPLEFLFAAGVGALAAAGLGALVASQKTDTEESKSTDNLVESALNSTKDAAKKGLAGVFVVFDNTKKALDEAGKSFQDFVSEARTEADKAKNGGGEEPAPIDVEIQSS